MPDARANQVPVQPVLFFTHVPKCAGSSLRKSMIELSVDKNLIWRPGGIRPLVGSRRDFRYVVGHFPYGIHRLIHPRSEARKRTRIYFTVIRDPIQQMISLYRYYVNYGMAEEMPGDVAGLESFILGNAFDNMQSRAHAGLAWWHDKVPLRRWGRLAPGVLFSIARRSILKNYDFILTQCQFGQQIEQLANQLDLRYKCMNETSTMTDSAEYIKTLSSDVTERLERLATADRMLFSWISVNVQRYGIRVSDWAR